MTNSLFLQYCVLLTAICLAVTVFIVRRMIKTQRIIREIIAERQAKIEYNLNYGIGLTSFPGYIARDIDNRLFAYSKPPVLIPESGIYLGAPRMQLPQELLPKLQYAMDPVPAWVEIRLFRPVEGEAFDVHIKQSDNGTDRPS